VPRAAVDLGAHDPLCGAHRAVGPSPACASHGVILGDPFETREGGGGGSRAALVGLHPVRARLPRTRACTGPRTRPRYAAGGMPIRVIVTD
jgi:hypothetical protein